MGKDDKEDSGFKDKAKAEETLKRLEKHEPNYRRLTVRGLLGRAKLSMTKAEEQIKNIKEAMEVFEKWLADLDAGKEETLKKPDKKKEEKEEKKAEKKEDSDSRSDVEMENKDQKKLPVDSFFFPGLGFKDKKTAEGTLKELEGRDPDYQKLAVKGLIGRAKTVLTCTRDETKLANINEAMGIFEKFLDDFDTNHLSKQNNAYLSLGIVRTAEKTAGDAVTEQQKDFIAAYSTVNGEYKRLRTVAEKDGGKTWDIIRNDALKELKEKHADAKLFNDKYEPTPEHLELLLWAYSPEATKIKEVVSETTDGDRKRNSSGGDDTPSKDEKKMPADSLFVTGLGFKDKETVESTLKELEGRDPDYQKLAVKGLIARAKRTLTCTRDETKLANIEEAMGIFEKFLDDFDTNHLSKQNNAYLSLGIVRTAEKSAGDAVTEQQKAFIAAYSSVNGEYKRLRTVAEKDGGKTWDIIRNDALKELKEKHVDAKLFNDKDEPTPEHLELLLWAYSPEATKVKAVVSETKDGDRKRKSSGGDDTPSKDEKKMPADSLFVPGLGFKDKETVESTLIELEGRDPDYQKLTVKGLIARAKRTLTCTRDETKLANIEEAMGIFEKFLDDFDTNHLSKQNNAYLSLGIVRTAEKAAGDAVTEQQKAFIAAYSSVNGEYKRLRTVAEKDGGKTWDIVRNDALKELKEKHVGAKLFNDKDEPTPEHLELLLWAYSPEATKVKKVVSETKDGDRKRKSSGGDDTPSKKKKE